MEKVVMTPEIMRKYNQLVSELAKYIVEHKVFIEDAIKDLRSDVKEYKK